MTEKKIWTELLDADTSPHLVSALSFINGMNIRYGSTDDGYIGFFENIKGNTQVANTLPAGTNICIGACADEANQWAIFFNQNSNGDDGIYLYDINNSDMYVVVEDADITGGLNFDKYKLINGAFVVNGILYFNDGSEDGQRRINLGVFMAAQGSSPVTEDYTITFPINKEEITLIKQPAAFPPSFIKKYNSGFSNNFIANDSFQFATQYVYFDGEDAVLSPWSASTMMNSFIENQNYVKVYFDTTEPVPQTVKLVKFVCKVASTNTVFEIYKLDRTKSSENTLINNGNISFDFYNNTTGEVLAESYHLKPFDNVPNVSETMERAKNRINLAGNQEGYDTPKTTSLDISLTASASLSGGGTLTHSLIEVRHRDTRSGKEYAYSGWYIFIKEYDYIGYYLINGTDSSVSGSTTYPTLPSAPTTGGLSSITFKGASLNTVFAETRPSGKFTTNEYSFTTTTNLYVTTGFLAIFASKLFLPGAQYKAGVVFYDKYLRKCGVVEGDSVNIPNRNHLLSTYYGTIDWELDNTDRLLEIPEWAHYYSPVLTLNQQTRNFVTSPSTVLRYATKDANGLFVYTATSFSSSVVAIAIDSTTLLQSGIGYSFNEGDQCILVSSSNVVTELAVIGQDGKYILIKPTDIGSLSSSTFIYRIYTPYKSTSQEPFYEQGIIFKINNPGGSSREYSQLTGFFLPDTSWRPRGGFAVEAMSPNDDYYERWYTNAGRINASTDLGAVNKKTGISFSNVWIPGTRTNGLSSFEALNKEILPEEMGVIKKLANVSKVQGEGSVLLAIGENQTASIYLGEVQLFDQRQTSVLARSDGYIGQINILQGDYGTQNPESVAVIDGQAAWIDVNRRAAVRYAANGLYPFSNEGMSRFFNLFCRKYKSLSAGDIEALGSRPYIFGGVDRMHGELLWSIPATESTHPKGTLADISPTIDYPYDIYDGKAKVLVYSVKMGKWSMPHDYKPEHFISIGNRIFCFKNGVLWENNTNNIRNNFFGVQGKSRLCGVARNSDATSKINVWSTVSVECNKVPLWMHFRTEEPNVQSSDLTSAEFDTREGILYAAILRDRLSPNVTGTANEKLFKGDKMRGAWMYWLADFDNTDLLKLKFVNIGSKVTAGHEFV